MRVFITGTAGFIGFHLARLLLAEGHRVAGFDGMTDYYDVRLKQRRHAILHQTPDFTATEAMLEDEAALSAAISAFVPDIIIHLAAQAGVRYSLSHPEAYVQSNLVGFMTILEECRAARIAHLIYASSSSVYGGNRKLPFAVSDGVDHPVSLYAATKKANELMAHSYARLYALPATGLRFFTVYGPWGRPDMAYWKFAEAILEGRPIDVYNHGAMARDFTYIDDAADAVVRLLTAAPTPDPGFDRLRPDPGSSWAPHRVFNVGNTRRETLLDMIGMLETALGRKAEKRLLPMQPGDVLETWADVSGLERAIGYRPDTPLAEGLARFAEWFVAWRAARPG